MKFHLHTTPHTTPQQHTPHNHSTPPHATTPPHHKGTRAHSTSLYTPPHIIAHTTTPYTNTPQTSLLIPPNPHTLHHTLPHHHATHHSPQHHSTHATHHTTLHHTTNDTTYLSTSSSSFISGGGEMWEEPGLGEFEAHETKAPCEIDGETVCVIPGGEFCLVTPHTHHSTTFSWATHHEASE